MKCSNLKQNFANTMGMEKVRTQPEYVNKDGSYYLMDEYDTLIAGMDEIWMMLDIEDGVIHKHGSHKNTKKHYDHFQAKLRDAAKDGTGDTEVLRHMADCMIMLDVTKIPLNELNHAIASSGYIKTLLKKYGIQSPN